MTAGTSKQIVSFVTFLHCIALLLTHGATAKEIVVGGEMGWTNFDLSTLKSPNYQTWASSQKVAEGDLVVFKFVAGQHNVNEMASKEAYLACDFSEAKELDGGATGTYMWRASKAGVHYFGCDKEVEGEGRHCSSGQRVAIEVVESEKKNGVDENKLTLISMLHSNPSTLISLAALISPSSTAPASSPPSSSSSSPPSSSPPSSSPSTAPSSTPPTASSPVANPPSTSPSKAPSSPVAANPPSTSPSKAPSSPVVANPPSSSPVANPPSTSPSKAPPSISPSIPPSTTTPVSSPSTPPKVAPISPPTSSPAIPPVTPPVTSPTTPPVAPPVLPPTVTPALPPTLPPVSAPPTVKAPSPSKHKHKKKSSHIPSPTPTLAPASLAGPPAPPSEPASSPSLGPTGSELSPSPTSPNAATKTNLGVWSYATAVALILALMH